MVCWLAVDRCHIFFCFQSSNYDELTIEQGESLLLIAGGDGEGWVKVSVDDHVVFMLYMWLDLCFIAFLG